MLRQARLPLVLATAAVAGIVVSAGCSIAPKVDRPVFAPTGSSWVTERRDTGSFGNGVSRVSSKALGEQTWQGRRLRAIEGQEGTLYTDPDTGSWVAFVRGTT